MSTYRSIVSKIRGMFKLMNTDNLINDRIIMEEVRATNIDLVVRDLQRRTSWNSPNLFTPIPCIQMEEYPLYKCCNIQSECMIARSVKPLPPIVDTKYNLVVQGVWSLDKKYRFDESGNPDRYANYLKLYPNGKKKFYWIQDNYLYITDSNIEKATLSAFFTHPIDPAQYSCDTSEKKCPTNPLDMEFKTLPKLEDSVTRMVYEKLLSTYKQSIQDTDQNNLDNSK